MSIYGAFPYKFLEGEVALGVSIDFVLVFVFSLIQRLEQLRVILAGHVSL